ncbi:uncharacterized protein BCR38DRAFT_103305 [Pseudomassariella vexata]|uniref:Uncharacterized protein n=1 Tax=Pseudomassariella vexata TaxID=1141098 RepID=A0A1Y2EG33_9PEZI|nr:uncharacterized protein BCR38DRAFT_103305 [Pseudomassariella vexata]ORY70264.1 hypothetical protein BCR38DRAFT_103305 [Pseudomassariella vexata]
METCSLCIKARISPAHLRACKLLDVVSPNHLELASLGGPAGSMSTNYRRQASETFVYQFLDTGMGPNGEGTIVVRCGEHGCFIISRTYAARWFPAFHAYSPDRAVDVIGTDR